MSSHEPKRFFLVVGPERTGTRLTTRILINAGCVGSAEHAQTFDNDDYSNVNNVVLRRSMPHNGSWQEFETQLVRGLKTHSVMCVVTTRDMYCTARSQVCNIDYVDSEKAAYANIQSSYNVIFSALRKWVSAPYVTVSYESLISEHGCWLQKWLYRELDLPVPPSMLGGIVDANAKYWGRVLS